MKLKKLSRKGEEGGTPMFKVVALIMVVAVVVLVISGVLGGWLKPLYEKLKLMWNYVLSFFGKKDTAGTMASKIDCTILGMTRTCEINYDDGWCKVDLGDRKNEPADITHADNSKIKIVGSYRISRGLLWQWRWGSMNECGKPGVSGFCWQNIDELVLSDTVARDKTWRGAFIDFRNRLVVQPDRDEDYTFQKKNLEYDSSCGFVMHSKTGRWCFGKGWWVAEEGQFPVLLWKQVNGKWEERKAGNSDIDWNVYKSFLKKFSWKESTNQFYITLVDGTKVQLGFMEHAVVTGELTADWYTLGVTNSPVTINKVMVCDQQEDAENYCFDYSNNQMYHLAGGLWVPFNPNVAPSSAKAELMEKYNQLKQELIDSCIGI